MPSKKITLTPDTDIITIFQQRMDEKQLILAYALAGATNRDQRSLVKKSI